MDNKVNLEMLDVYTDDNKEKIGIASRDVVHYYNLWHREIACWVVNDKKEILLQRRSPSKRQAPNMLSITAGHVDIDEIPIKAAIREIAEEIGATGLEDADFIYLDTFKAENKNNCHYKYVYVWKTDKKIEEFKMQESEVSELKYVSLEELKRMIDLPNNELTFSKHYYTPIILKKIEELL